jgi:hypothetical protein
MIVNTTHGEIDDSLLEKKTGVIDNENETTSWVEYWLDGELIHRSVDIKLKEGAISATVAGVFG